MNYFTVKPTHFEELVMEPGGAQDRFFFMPRPMRDGRRSQHTQRSIQVQLHFKACASESWICNRASAQSGQLSLTMSWISWRADTER